MCSFIKSLMFFFGLMHFTAIAAADAKIVLQPGSEIRLEEGSLNPIEATTVTCEDTGNKEKKKKCICTYAGYKSYVFVFEFSFLDPISDIYRVVTRYSDDEDHVKPWRQCKLALEAHPGCEEEG